MAPRRGAAAPPSLLSVPDSWLDAAPLAELKRAALRAGLERGWQRVGREHRRALATALAETRRDALAFVATVASLGRDRAVALGRREVASEHARAMAPGAAARRDKAATAALRERLGAAMQIAMRAAVHVVPSGSGAHVGGGYVLTCAHCVAHDDDEEEEEEGEEEEEEGEEGRVLTSPTSSVIQLDDDDDPSDDDDDDDVVDLTRDADADADAGGRTRGTPPVPQKKKPDEKPNKRPSHRVGRFKDLVDVTGAVASSECVFADEASDLALLRLLPFTEDAEEAADEEEAAEEEETEKPPVISSKNPRRSSKNPPLSSARRGFRRLRADSLGVLRVARRDPGPGGVPVVAVGNPFDWDLEAPAGAAPTKNGYTPFWVSLGRTEGLASRAYSKKRSLGRLKHSAWTYWGHSGCALVSDEGELVGVHNSWCAENDAQRHGVALEDVRAFLEEARGAVKGAPREGFLVS
jgi:hypothetical protein